MIAESERIKIRDIVESDADDLAKLCDDSEAHALMNVGNENFNGLTAERILQIFSAAQSIYAIELKQRKKKVIGFIFVRHFDEFKIKNFEDPLHINCVIHPSLRGKGYGRESVYAFMSYMFKNYPNCIFVSRASISNVPSVRIMNRYMKSISRVNKEHNMVYFASTAKIFFSKTKLGS